jgi:hypothetical protein
MKFSFVEQVIDFLKSERETKVLSEKNFLSELLAVDNKHSNLPERERSNLEINYMIKNCQRFSDDTIEKFCWILALLSDNSTIEDDQFWYTLLKERLQLRGNIEQRFLPDRVLQLKVFLFDKYFRKEQDLYELICLGVQDHNNLTYSYLELFELLRPRVISKTRPRPKKKVWRRGYNDHGNLGKDHPERYIIFSKELKEEEQLEDERRKIRNAHLFLEGFTE